MTPSERLQHEIKQAMLARDAGRLNALRALKSAIGYVQIEKRTDALSDPDFIAVVQREIKKRRDSAQQFTDAGRTELQANENFEITVLETFLPQQLSAEELETLVRPPPSRNWAPQTKNRWARS